METYGILAALAFAILATIMAGLSYKSNHKVFTGLFIGLAIFCLCLLCWIAGV
jgi:MFS-type transporter involved in bile tolerance (Atg22 family)